MKKTYFFLSIFLLIVIYTWAQDIIITKDAQKIDAKITEMSKTEIRYKELDNLDGPVYVLSTTELNSIILSNGKVMVFNQENQPKTEPEPAQPEQQTQTEEPAESQAPPKDYYAPIGLDEARHKALADYIDGLPKKVVAAKGDYSVLYNKKNRIYFDIDYTDAELVLYGYGEYINEPEPMSSFQTFLDNEPLDFDFNYIIQSTCSLYSQKMISKKCKLFTIAELDTANISAGDYKMVLHMQRVDAGNGAMSVLAGQQTNAGGAVISGYIEIINLSTGEPDVFLVVDRAKGIGAPRANVRIRQTVEEIITNQLFFIKDYKQWWSFK